MFLEQTIITSFCLTLEIDKIIQVHLNICLNTYSLVKEVLCIKTITCFQKLINVLGSETVLAREAAEGAEA